MPLNAFFQQDKVCPLCEKKFAATRVRSSACFVMKRDTDFHVTYRDVNPLLYSIWVCPNCQYANGDKDFTEDLKPHDKERLKKGLSMLRSEEPDFGGERTPQVALRAVELAIRTAQIRKSPAIVQAGLFLRAAWLCRDLGKKELEMNYLEQARNLYQHSFEKEWGCHSAKMSDSRIMYLIGELNRRLGNNEEAVKWFSRTVINKDIRTEPEINRLVRDQWEIAREEYKKQQAQSGENIDDSAVLTDTDSENNTENKSAEPEVKLNPGAAPKSRGSKVKMFISLYMDQVDWLKNISNKAYDKNRVFIEKEAVARAIIDAVMEKYPELTGFNNEEELKNLVLEKISKVN